MSNLFATATQPANPATTFSDILPVPSQTQSHGDGGPKPDVYYLVLLGILVVLIIFAALLTLRGHRMRRRYRTATQIAIARGDPVSWWHTDNPGVHDVLYQSHVGPAPGPLGDWAAIGGKRRQRRWVRIPVLWDAVAEDDGMGDNRYSLPSEKLKEKETDTQNMDSELEWEGIQPLATQSSLAEPMPDRPAPQPAQPIPPPPPVSVLGLIRYGFSHVPQIPPVVPPPPAPAPRVREADRVLSLAEGEPLRVSVLIQMPMEPSEMEHERMRRERERDVDEDEAGWRAGMEIGVWQGEVERYDQRSVAESAYQSEWQSSGLYPPGHYPPGEYPSHRQYPPPAGPPPNHYR